MLQERNAQERLQVDAVFGERIQAESSIKELEAQVTHHQARGGGGGGCGASWLKSFLPVSSMGVYGFPN